MTKQEYAYRGYIVKRSPFTGSWFVSKDGFHITEAVTSRAAEEAIEALAN